MKDMDKRILELLERAHGKALTHEVLAQNYGNVRKTAEVFRYQFWKAHRNDGPNPKKSRK